MEEQLKYGCEKFENRQYAEALEIFVSLYNNGYKKEWILKKIYDHYMKEVDEVFRKTFDKYVCGNNELYEECIIDFIPYKDGQYFIFDKNEKVFKGLFSALDLYNEAVESVFQKNESSDIIIAYNGDYRQIGNFIVSVGKRKIYLLPQNYKLAISFYKIPELETLMENTVMFSNLNECKKYFHLNTEKYIPKLIFSEDSDEIELIKNILQEEHDYRLTDQGRNTKQVLLTIGIPTHNRGNLLLKRIEHLKNMPYDSEIEVVIAKNGNTLYQEEYRRACKELDSRFIYYGVDEELKPHQNWYNIIKHSHGKYVLFVSDEDDVVIEALDHYLELLDDNPDVGQIRAKTSGQYAWIQNMCGSKGVEAFKLCFLVQNYLSGLIVNRQKIIDANVMKYEKYWDNAFYRNYPHEWWCAELSRTGDCLRDSTLLIEEKDQVLNEEYEKYEQLGIMQKKEVFDEDSGLPKYATYQGRFEQFKGQVEFLDLFMKKNKLGLKIGLITAINKLAYLLNLARSNNYRNEKYLDIIDEYAHVTMDAMDQFKFNNNDQREILMIIKQNCECLIVNDEQMI